MTYFLSLGANLGNREETIREAIQRIEEQIGTVPCCSSFYYSEPWGFESENRFCNVCCRLETTMEPMEVLRATQAIERALGRTHKTINTHYSDRIIDIDLIQAFDHEGREIRCQINDYSQKSEGRPSLILPHPLWQERDFVKIPLKEIIT